MADLASEPRHSANHLAVDDDAAERLTDATEQLRAASRAAFDDLTTHGHETLVAALDADPGHALRLAQASRARVAADFHHRRSAEAVADGLARSLPEAARTLGRGTA